MRSPSANHVASYRPLEAAAYLRTRGWHLEREEGERYSIWRKQAAKGNPFEVLLPTMLDAPDLAVRLQQLVETVSAAERRSVDEVREDMTTPNCDIVRARLLSEGDDLTLPLDGGADAFRYARDLLLSAASAAWQTRAVYGSKKPDAALDLIRHARLGQTQPGSYAIKIIVPLRRPSGNAAAWGIEETPPARRMTLMLVRGLRAVLAAVREAAQTGHVRAIEAGVGEG